VSRYQHIAFFGATGSNELFLGLDPGRFRSGVTSETEDRPFGSLDSQIPDKDRFKDAEPFVARCRGCSGVFEVTRVGTQETPMFTPAGPSCPACHTQLGTPSLQVQLELHIRQHIAKYYEGWTVCDDPTCDQRTRMMSVYGRRCLRVGCRGSVSFEASLQLYNQLMYCASLFNGNKTIATAKGTSRQGETFPLKCSKASAQLWSFARGNNCLGRSQSTSAAGVIAKCRQVFAKLWASLGRYERVVFIHEIIIVMVVSCRAALVE